MWSLSNPNVDSGDSGDANIGDYDRAGIGKPKAGQPGTPSKRTEKPKAWRPSAWESVALDAISAFATSIVNGDIKNALKNSFRALVRGVINAVAESVSSSMGGFGGALTGTIVGGLVGWGLSKLFKLGKKNSRGPEEDSKPVIVAVANWPDALKHWVLPSSGYFNPTGLYNPRRIIQHNSNTINVSAGPKVGALVQRALTEVAFQDQLLRGLV